MQMKKLFVAMVAVVFITFFWGLVNAARISELSADQEAVFVEAPSPYEFGYEFGDGLGARQYRKEVSDGNGIVAGSYGYQDIDGMYRNVEYKADANGYRATVKSNEPGLANQNSADATFIVEPPLPSVLAKNSVVLADDRAF